MGDEVVGAIGTSGETPDEDESVSIAGAAAEFSTASRAGADLRGRATAPRRPSRAECTRRGVAPVCAVVDAGGELIYLWRPDDAQVASVGVATDKARTAAIYRRPSKDFEEQAASGRPSALHLARAVPLQGGMPILHDGEVIGAVGVSGASSADEDQELADARRARRSPRAGAPTDASFFGDRGGPGEVRDGRAAARRRRLQARRRPAHAPGEVEYHAHTVDVMHIVEGRRDRRSPAARWSACAAVGDGELRAESVNGGHAHDLSPGDVLAVPAGVPHQFTRVSDPFLYFVVKVEA